MKEYEKSMEENRRWVWMSIGDEYEGVQEMGMDEYEKGIYEYRGWVQMSIGDEYG